MLRRLSAAGAVVLTACGGTGSPDASAAASDAAVGSATVTVNAEGCELSLTPFGTMPAGLFTLEAVNETSNEAEVDMWLIDESASFDELVAHIEAEQDRATAGEPGLGRPDFVSGLIGSGTLEPNQSKTVSDDTTPGTYGVVCLRHFPLVTDGPVRPFTVLGPIEFE